MIKIIYLKIYNSYILFIVWGFIKWIEKKKYNQIAKRVVGHVENNTDQAEKILAIPTSDYTCKKRWNSEINKIFKELPLMLALSN